MGITKMAKITQYSAVNLMQEAGVDPRTWNSIPTDEVVEKTAKAIESRGIRVIIARNAQMMPWRSSKKSSRMVLK